MLMLVIIKTKSTVKIVGAINTMLFSECCHSYLGKYIIALSGEKCNKYHTKSVTFCCDNVMQKTKIIPEVS